MGSVKRIFSARVRISRSGSSKVINFCTNRKRVCDFLLVRHSNLGPIFHRFRDCRFFTPSLFHHNFGGVPVAPDRPCWGSARAEAVSYSAVKLFSKYSNLCDQDTWTSHTDRRTGRQTDDRLFTALCISSRGKNWKSPNKVENIPLYNSCLILKRNTCS